jgi:NAD(P)-dependent dehydrogenase (short-subunit alcohol dehydrogenase family)
MKTLITGGTGSVGKELLDVFSREKGCQITFTYYDNYERAKSLAEKYNAEAISLKEELNVSNDYDIIINNIGIVNSLELCENVELGKWEETLEVNLTLPFKIIKSSLPYMKQKGYGRIVNIASIYGVKAEEGFAPYIAAKHGLIGLTKAVAREYGAFGITSNAICPGTIDSEMADRIADFYTHNAQERAEYFKIIKNEVPAKRLANPKEVAEFAYFIASDKAAYINGATLILDGGYTA